ncbi:MAG: hemerythrin domain-containing protein [Deltaproteobacteria bacterium]|nr:hemerythrin domain-containing protein [Deltaproteobacteria bacterium]
MLKLEEPEFKALSSANGGGKGTFKSPPGACRLGFSQTFKVTGIENVEERGGDEGWAEEAAAEGNNPLLDLVEEHKEVLKKLDAIESQVRKRDVEGLWVTTASVENDIILHSIKKEEEVLFPIVEKKIPMGEALVGIMKEDHREFIAILQGFRCGLQDGDILDGLVTTLIVNLRNHISKEDEEFLPMIDAHLDREEKDRVFEAMKKIEKEHVRLTPGDREKKGLSPLSEDRRRMDAEIMALKSITSKGGEACCH